jgi:hypothetical protein
MRFIVPSSWPIRNTLALPTISSRGTDLLSSCPKYDFLRSFRLTLFDYHHAVFFGKNEWATRVVDGTWLVGETV